MHFGSEMTPNLQNASNFEFEFVQYWQGRLSKQGQVLDLPLARSSSLQTQFNKLAPHRNKKESRKKQTAKKSQGPLCC